MNKIRTLIGCMFVCAAMACSASPPVTDFNGTPGTFSTQASKQAPGNTASAESEEAHPEIPRITAEELKQLVDKKADIVVVDTQSVEGYDSGHVPTSVNIPYSPTDNPMDREMTLIALPMTKLIVLYCDCIDGADSAAVALQMRDLRYDNDKVKVLKGGLNRWRELAYPLIKQKSQQ